MLSVCKSKQTGVSLTETLIALGLGAMLLTLSFRVVFSVGSANHSQLAHIQLDNELHSLLALLSAELRRAGYWSQPPGATAGLQPTPAAWRLAPATWRVEPGSGDYDCVLFAYDIDHDGSYRSRAQAVAPGQIIEGFGFRHDAVNQTIEVRRNERGCTEGYWEDLTSPDQLVIERLRFALHSSTSPYAPSGHALHRYRIQMTVVASLPDGSNQRQVEQWVNLPNGVLL